MILRLTCVSSEVQGVASHGRAILISPDTSQNLTACKGWTGRVKRRAVTEAPEPDSLGHAVMLACAPQLRVDDKFLATK